MHWFLKFPTRSDRCLLLAQVLDRVHHVGLPAFRWRGKGPSCHAPRRRRVGPHLQSLPALTVRMGRHTWIQGEFGKEMWQVFLVSCMQRGKSRDGSQLVGEAPGWLVVPFAKENTGWKTSFQRSWNERFGAGLARVEQLNHASVLELRTEVWTGAPKVGSMTQNFHWRGEVVPQGAGVLTPSAN